MTTSTLVYSSGTGFVAPQFDSAPEVTDDPWGVVCCLGMDGIVSSASCNRIAVMTTGEWCPHCHPGDDVPISVLFE